MISINIMSYPSLAVRGWRVQLSPEVPSLRELDIDIIVGADGKRNTLEGQCHEEYNEGEG